MIVREQLLVGNKLFEFTVITEIYCHSISLLHVEQVEEIEALKYLPYPYLTLIIPLSWLFFLND